MVVLPHNSPLNYMKKIPAIGLVVVAVIVLSFVVFAVIKKPVAPVSRAADAYKNATYVIDGSSVTLTDGSSVVPTAPGSASTTTTQYFGNMATGDLNTDGLPDVAFILTQNGGGSGTFYYAVAALKTATGYTGTNAILLGDRISPQTTEVSNGVVTVNYADRNMSDPMTTDPSVGVSKYLKIVGGKLMEVANPADFPTTYLNSQYGFTFSLPADWQGYSIVEESWMGTPLGTTSAQTGPKLLIRNPQWSPSKHYEDIPILVFSTQQWDSYTAGDFAVSAAPFPATEIGRNSSYVFALPPRWDYDYSQGYQEADTIVGAKTLIAF